MFMSGRQNAGRIQNIKLAEFSVKCRNHGTFATVRVTSSARNTIITSSSDTIVCDNHREVFLTRGPENYGAGRGYRLTCGIRAMGGLIDPTRGFHFEYFNKI